MSFKLKIENQNQISKSNLEIKIKMLKHIYNQNGYLAQVSEDGTCVVHRHGELVPGQPMSAHCGEKTPSQDWREVQLYGVPHEIRVAIVEAWKEWLAGKA